MTMRHSSLIIQPWLEWGTVYVLVIMQMDIITDYRKDQAIIKINALNAIIHLSRKQLHLDHTCNSEIVYCLNGL